MSTTGGESDSLRTNPAGLGGRGGGPGRGEASHAKRERIVFHGRVQGVFFRATTAELAQRRAVVGYVRNMPDGSVEMEVQGASEEIDALLAAVNERYRENITCMDRRVIPLREDEREFRIRH